MTIPDDWSEIQKLKQENERLKEDRIRFADLLRAAKIYSICVKMMEDDSLETDREELFIYGEQVLCQAKRVVWPDEE